jgi:hypothetical protein
MKTVILYAYSEYQKGPTKANNSYNNLKFFLDNGLIKNKQYLFCININGKYEFNFSKYLEDYNNLKLFFGNGKSSFEAYLNILNNIDINLYDNFIFIKDKVRGPYNLDKIKLNWIDFYTSKLNDINSVVISAYGCSPLAKIYKMPYIPMKFMVMNKKALEIIVNNNLFEKYEYDPSYLQEKRKNPENMFEIGFSHYLLKNNLNYIAVDTLDILDLKLNNIYPDFNKLLEISKKYYEICDINIPNRIFWTENTMIDIFEKNNLKSCKKRSSKNIGVWK